MRKIPIEHGRVLCPKKKCYVELSVCMRCIHYCGCETQQLDLKRVMCGYGERASEKELLRFWTYQQYLEVCKRCPKRSICWDYEGITYDPEVILQVCHDKNVRTAVKRMEEMKKGKPLLYYALTLDQLYIIEKAHRLVWGK